MAKAKKEPAQYTIQNCDFAAVRWDKASIETLQTVAKALLNLTELFRSQEVKVDTMIHIGDGEPKVAGK